MGSDPALQCHGRSLTHRAEGANTLHHALRGSRVTCPGVSASHPKSLPGMGCGYLRLAAHVKLLPRRA